MSSSTIDEDLIKKNMTQMEAIVSEIDLLKTRWFVECFMLCSFDIDPVILFETIDCTLRNILFDSLNPMNLIAIRFKD